MAMKHPPMVVTWVDQSIGEVGTHKSIKDRFETLSTFISQWLYFNSSDEFTSYVENHSNVKIISVMSGGMSRLLVPRLSHHACLESVYVFCADRSRAREALEGEAKVKGIFTIEDDLYEQMTNDLSRLLLEEGVELAKIDERNAAKLNYEEAKRLLNTLQEISIDEDEKKTRIEEINVRIDQLLV